MRTLCDVCEASPACFFCAADEAALCYTCDEKVHGCNKLASRHIRLVLAEACAVPRCDICENASAFFLCEIDGTSLCLQCDMNVHVGGKKTHQRYLLMRQRVEIPQKPDEEFMTQPATADIALNGKANQKQYHGHTRVYQQNGEEKTDSSAIAMAVGDIDMPSPDEWPTSKMIDLNSHPSHLCAKPSNVMQSFRDVKLANGIDKGDSGMAPILSVKGKNPAHF
eukprot:c24496_g1_i2 orf=294-962(-)